jgi:beta-glucosidase
MSPHKKFSALFWILWIALIFFLFPTTHFFSADASKFSSIKQKVEAILPQMTLEEKIGQMTQIDSQVIMNNLQDISAYGIGSLLSGGNSGPSFNSPESWANMVDRFQSYALKSRLKIPLIYGIDSVHGLSHVKGATVFPHNIGLGAARNPVLVEKIARITAMETAALGIKWTFAPCIAVPQDIRWGRTYEGFSEDPKLVSLLGASAIKGSQSTNLSDPTSILACAKHFAGDGGTEFGTGYPELLDQGDARIPEKELRSIHIFPYIAAISNGAASVMASFSSWNEIKMHQNKYLLTDVLRKELKFSGILVSDWAAVKQLPGTPEEQVKLAINAGIDMVMVPDSYQQFIGNLTALVRKQEVSEERIDEAVRRILTLKYKLGLFEHPYSHRELLAQVGGREHRELAREAVRKSLVLLKNKDKILPLSKKLKKIIVAGRKADDIGSQCGGWTITWQGATGAITTGTSILQAIKKAVSTNTIVFYSTNGENCLGADAVIAVVGEGPYAEMKGDREDLSLKTTDLKTIRNIKDAGVPVVVILISGRPMIVTSEIKSWNAFIAAWLPGTEGEGIADILFGDYQPAGKLSYTWPASMDQVPLRKAKNSHSKPLYPYGFGLSY